MFFKSVSIVLFIPCLVNYFVHSNDIHYQTTDAMVNGMMQQPHNQRCMLVDEHDDLWRSVRSVQSALKRQYNCDAFNVAVQDGVGAGQSVPHVHVHILPRYRGDWERNDDIYDQLESWAPRDEMSVNKPKIVVPVDSERRDRTVDEMAEEALLYRSLFDES